MASPTLTRSEQSDLRTLALYGEWHYVSPVVFPGHILEGLERKGLLRLRWTGGPVWPKREALLTDRGRALAATLTEPEGE